MVSLPSRSASSDSERWPSKRKSHTGFSLQFCARRKLRYERFLTVRSIPFRSVPFHSIPLRSRWRRSLRHLKNSTFMSLRRSFSVLLCHLCCLSMLDVQIVINDLPGKRCGGRSLARFRARFGVGVREIYSIPFSTLPRNHLPCQTDKCVCSPSKSPSPSK